MQLEILYLLLNIWRRISELIMMKIITEHLLHQLVSVNSKSPILFHVIYVLSLYAEALEFLHVLNLEAIYPSIFLIQNGMISISRGAPNPLAAKVL